MRLLAHGACAALVATGVHAADGLAVPEGAWPRWQVRAALAASEQGAARPAHWVPVGPQGGLRATGGVIQPAGRQPGLPRSLVLGADSAESMPYLGLGYTRLASDRGWGFTADLGLVAQNTSQAVRLGRALLGQPQDLEDAVRGLRLSPMLQLGVRYSF
jgi:hypothetical protein